MNIRTARLAALALAASSLTACGGGAAPAETPQAPANYPAGDMRPESPEGALAAFDRAEGEIGRVLGGFPGGAVAPQQPGYGQAPSVLPPPPPTADSSVSPRGAEPPRPSSQRGADKPAVPMSDPCTVACSALASMERSATHLCGLTTEADARCAGARSRLKNASERVKASCPSCVQVQR